MSTYDTSTNSRSVSFSNAYSQATLNKSSTRQYVYGFYRTQGKRYYEFYIDKAGADNRNLWLGHIGLDLAGSGVNRGRMIGGHNKTRDWDRSNFMASTTATSTHSDFKTGDTVMVSVDFGGGVDHAGTQRNFTVSDGRGNLLLPVLVEIGQNSSWGLCYYNDYIYAAGNQSGKQRPIVAVDPEIADSAKVSLRVVTASFVNALPAGFTAWGTGPGDNTVSATSTASSSGTTSATITPSGTVPPGGSQVLWPYGVMT